MNRQICLCEAAKYNGRTRLASSAQLTSARKRVERPLLTAAARRNRWSTKSGGTAEYAAMIERANALLPNDYSNLEPPWRR